MAEDREQHLRQTILPGLAENDVVLTDRYIASSLVFQVLDGVPLDEVWRLNRDFLLPDLNIFLAADVGSIRRRYDERATLTRFDQTLSVEDEIDQYRTAAASMAARGVRIAEVMNGDQAERGRTAVEIATHVHEAIGKHS